MPARDVVLVRRWYPAASHFAKLLNGPPITWPSGLNAHPVISHHMNANARNLFSRLLGDVILRLDAQGLLAEVRGNLGLLLEDVPSIGAGRGISDLASWPAVPFVA